MSKETSNIAQEMESWPLEKKHRGFEFYNEHIIERKINPNIVGIDNFRQKVAHYFELFKSSEKLHNAFDIYRETKDWPQEKLHRWFAFSTEHIVEKKQLSPCRRYRQISAVF